VQRWKNDTKENICEDICGDGKRVPKDDEAYSLTFPSKCDDGNLNNNDGCSSTCTIEEHFICRGGNEFTKDYCEDPRPLGVNIYLNKTMT
jgi:cysteine-rich repeat protein